MTTYLKLIEAASSIEDLIPIVTKLDTDWSVSDAEANELTVLLTDKLLEVTGG